MARRDIRRREKEEGERFRDRLCRRLDIVPDLVSGEPTVEIRGRSLVSVQGGERILTYTPEEIRIALKRGCVRIKGKDLVCISYYVGAIGVEGRIFCVCFEEGE